MERTDSASLERQIAENFRNGSMNEPGSNGWYVCWLQELGKRTVTYILCLRAVGPTSCLTLASKTYKFPVILGRTRNTYLISYNDNRSLKGQSFKWNQESVSKHTCIFLTPLFYIIIICPSLKQDRNSCRNHILFSTRNSLPPWHSIIFVLIFYVAKPL